MGAEQKRYGRLHVCYWFPVTSLSTLDKTLRIKNIPTRGPLAKHNAKHTNPRKSMAGQDWLTFCREDAFKDTDPQQSLHLGLLRDLAVRQCLISWREINVSLRMSIQGSKFYFTVYTRAFLYLGQLRNTNQC